MGRASRCLFLLVAALFFFAAQYIRAQSTRRPLQPVTPVIEDYGVCGHKIRELMRYGGAISKVLTIRPDYTRLQSWFNHEYGEEGPFFHGLDLDEVEEEKRPAAVDQALASMAEASEALQGGKIWYLIYNRRVFFKQGMRPLYVDPENSSRTTKWRPQVLGIIRGKCVELQGDAAIFREDIPRELQEQLPKDAWE